MSDVIESLSFCLIELIEERGGEILFYDPKLPFLSMGREYAGLTRKTLMHVMSRFLVAWPKGGICLTKLCGRSRH